MATVRIPNQVGAVNLYENLFVRGGQATCRGVVYRGAQDLARLVNNPINGPNYCSLSRAIASGTLGCGVSFF